MVRLEDSTHPTQLVSFPSHPPSEKHMKTFRYLVVSAAFCAAVAAVVLSGDQRSAAQAPKGGQVKNHEGRVLPPMPEITKPVMFNTPEADAILAAMQIFPKDNAWNEDISKQP